MYTIKLLKQNFVNLIISSFEKIGENGPRLEEDYKEKKVPEKPSKQTLKKLLEDPSVKPKLKTNTQIVKDALGPDYIGKDGQDLKEIMGEKTKEELKQEKEAFGFSKEIMGNLSVSEKKILKEVLGNRTIHQASSGEVYTLKQEGFDLSKIFLQKQSGEFVKGKSEIKTGGEFIVDFHGNKDIDRIVGIGDILDINNVSEISVNGVNGKRKSSPRPGFYSSRYLAIHDNYKINILKEEKFEGDEFKNAAYDRFSQVRGKELNTWFYTHLNSGDSSINIPFETNSDKELFKKYIEGSFKKELKYDFDNNILSTVDGNSLESKKDIISSYMIPKDASELMNIPGFKEKLEKICSNLGINKNDLLLVMGAESNYNPQAVNRGSGASGLIQFMPSTARGLGTTVGAIRQMGAVEQLTLVEKYFKPYSGRLHNITDLYKVVFFPISLGKADYWVYRSKKLSASKVSNQNPAISKYSTRSDGLIDGYAFKRYVTEHVASKAIIYEDIKNNVSEVEESDDVETEIMFNTITFYHGEIESSFDQFILAKEDISKTGKIIVERGSEKLSNQEISKIKKEATKKFGDKIKIVINTDRSYGGQIDV